MRAPWGPVVDGLDIPDQPRSLFERNAFNAVPVMIGTAGDEGWNVVDRAFPAGLSAAVYRAEVEAEFGSAAMSAILEHYPSTGESLPTLARLVGDVEAVCEARRVARLIARSKVPVFLYSLTSDSRAAPGRGRHGDKFFSGTFATHVTSFVISGNPNTGERAGVDWPQACDLWEPFFLRSVSGSIRAAQP
jgi:carboxylesterase type B